MKSAKTPTTALDAANYLIERASRDRRFLDPMTLQKVLYFAQCWSLAEHDSPLFDDEIEAWKFGPVVRVVWKAYSGKRPIVPDGVFFDELSEAQKAVLDAVWLAYRDHSAVQLSKLTHQQEPWRVARRGVSEDQPSRSTLSRALMKKAAQESLAKSNAWLGDHWSRLIDTASTEAA
jgi:uncharacterized phage-associated protein